MAQANLNWEKPDQLIRGFCHWNQIGTNLATQFLLNNLAPKLEEEFSKNN